VFQAHLEVISKSSRSHQLEQRYEYYNTIVDAVDDTIELIRDLPLKKCYDTEFLEQTFIPRLGLNNENLNEQPPELAHAFGKSLHIFQYPNQLAKYLVWMSHNARETRKYMEIGCRWGGTFILTSEWLKKIGAPLECSIAVDPIRITPFIERYKESSSHAVLYINKLSTDPDFIRQFNVIDPDYVFVDGDHSMRGVMFDHLLVRGNANIIGHHDISSIACPDTTLFWSYLKQGEPGFRHNEFVDQYPSVQGSFLGIGVLKRRT
jgi:hypothetical protein